MVFNTVVEEVNYHTVERVGDPFRRGGRVQAGAKTLGCCSGVETASGVEDLMGEGSQALKGSST